jgi:hypothetical protein
MNLSEHIKSLSQVKGDDLDYNVRIIPGDKIDQINELENIHHIIDNYQEHLDELFDIEFPWLDVKTREGQNTKLKWLTSNKKNSDLVHQGNWILYPWLNTLVHLPLKEDFERLHGSRNCNLISEEDQRILRSKTLAIAGMSVGSNVLLSLVMGGIGGSIKIADFDTISIPNLNRIQANSISVGMNKGVFFARKALEINPYLSIDLYRTGLKEEEFFQYFTENRVDLYIEEMDDVYLKLKSRNYARAQKIPVIMGADNGDGVLLDVERFDKEPLRPLMHGRLSDIDVDSLDKSMKFADKLMLITRMVGRSEITVDVQKSIQEVGTKLHTWPQLGTAATMVGSTLTYLARKILLDQDMPSGRYELNPLSLVPEHNTPELKDQIKNQTAEFLSGFERYQEWLTTLEKI